MTKTRLLKHDLHFHGKIKILKAENVTSNDSFQVPEGPHPRGTTLREALRGNWPLREGSAGLSERAPRGLSARVLRGLCGVLQGYAGFSEGFRG